MPQLFLALYLASSLAPGTALSVDPATSLLRYHITHKLHHVSGESNQLEGKAVIQPGGTVQTMVRVAVVSFRSGDANRDSHMEEVLNPNQHPFVVFKGVTQLGSTEAGGQVTMNGELDFNGVKTPVSVPLEIELKPDGAVRAHGSFDVSLDAHKVERPSLLFVKIDDACRIDIDLMLRKANP